MHLVQMLLPLRDNQKQPFPRSEFRRVYDELTERFGGVTGFLQSPAFGTWKEDDGQTLRDELVLVEVLTEKLDEGWWNGYRAELEKRFAQEKILCRALVCSLL